MKQLVYKIITNKYVILLCVLIAGIAIGRFSLPAKIVTEIKTEIIEKIVYKEKQDINKDKVVIIEETTAPDGTKTKKTTIVDKSKIIIDKDQQTNKDTKIDNTTITYYDKNTWIFGALMHTSFLNSQQINLQYGIQIQRRLFGPFYLGAFGFTDKRIGLNISIVF